MLWFDLQQLGSNPLEEVEGLVELFPHDFEVFHPDSFKLMAIALITG